MDIMARCGHHSNECELTASVITGSPVSLVFFCSMVVLCLMHKFKLKLAFFPRPPLLGFLPFPLTPTYGVLFAWIVPPPIFH